MIKVYQTIHGRGKGNCLVATIASLLELNIEDVPHFNETPNWFNTLFNFMRKHEYDITHLYNTEEAKYRKGDGYAKWYDENKDKINDLERIKDFDGVNGYFEAAVYSPKYYNSNDEIPALHSVIIDKNFNIIHDPEENYKNIKEYPMTKEIGYNGIVHITAIKKLNNKES